MAVRLVVRVHLRCCTFRYSTSRCHYFDRRLDHLQKGWIQSGEQGLAVQLPPHIDDCRLHNFVWIL